VHCVSAYEGDIIVLGSDGVFDNLFLDEVVDICNEAMSPGKPGAFVPTQPALLSQIAKRIVEESHAKSRVGRGGQLPETPIGRGGKMDDTSVVVGEVVEWTAAHSEVWAQVRRQRRWRNMVTCGGMDNIACKSCQKGDEDVDEDEVDLRRHLSGGSSRDYYRQQSTENSELDDEREKCAIA